MLNKIKKLLAKKIFFGIVLFFLLGGSVFGYNCTTNPNDGKRIFVKGDGGDVFIVNIITSEMLPHDTRECDDITLGWNAIGENCSFTGKLVLNVFKIRSDADFDDQDGCPYEVVGKIDKTLSSTGGKVGFERDMKIIDSDASIMLAMFNFSEVKLVNGYFSDKKLFLFGGKYNIGEGEGALKTSVEIEFDSDSSLKNFKVNELQYNNNYVIANNFISSSGGTLKATINGSGCFASGATLFGSDKDNKCNLDTNIFTGSIKKIFRYDAFVGKYGDKYIIVGGKYGSGNYLNNILIYDSVSTGAYIGSGGFLGTGVGEFSKIDISSGYGDLIGGTIDGENGGIYGIFKNGDEIQVKKYNFSGESWSDFGSEITLYKPHYSSLQLNCNGGSCELFVIGGSDKQKGDFLNGERIRNDNIPYFNGITIYSLSNSPDLINYELDKKVFGYTDSNGNISTGGIIDTNFYVNNDGSIIIDKFTKKKGNYGANITENSCVYTETFNGFSLDESKDNFVFINKNNYKKAYKIGFTDTVNVSSVDVSIPSLYNNGVNTLTEYGGGSQAEINKKIYSCYWQDKVAPTNNVNNGLLTIKTPIAAALGGLWLQRRNLLEDRSGQYISGQSYTQILIKSGLGDNDEVILSPIQTINGKVYFGGSFKFGSGNYLGAVFNEVNDDFSGYNNDNIEEMINISTQRIYHGTNMHLVVSGSTVTEGARTQYELEELGGGNIVDWGVDKLCILKKPPNDNVVRRKDGYGNDTNQVERLYQYSGSVAGGKKWVSNQCDDSDNLLTRYPTVSLGSGITAENGKAVLLGDNLERIANNGQVSSGSFLFKKEFAPGFHQVHLIIAKISSGSGFSLSDIIKANEIRGNGGKTLATVNDFQGRDRDVRRYDLSALGVTGNIDDIPETLDIQYKLYAYQFYIPEITNTSQKISGTIPTFVGKYIPKDSQLFFYSSENGNDEFRINDIPKNYTKIHTGYSLGGSNTDFSDTSDKIKNLVQLVDNSMLHHKIRPSSFSGSLAGGFKYSPVYHFPKSGTGYLKYFYIDSKGNIIGGKQKEFKIGTGTIITFNNFTNESNEIITDSVQPFIYGNYEPDEVINGSIVGNGKIQSIAIKTDLNGNFKFQPREKLKEGETYTINLNGGQKKLNILENKNIPEIISHTSGNIEVGKRPIFFGNGKPGEDIKIEVFNEDQYVNSTSTGFSNIKCKKLTASNGYKKTFTGTDVYSCSELGNIGSIIPFSTTGITIKDNGNWTWQLDKDLQEIETDSINIYFVKVYYSDDPEHYDLISFRYFPKKEPQTFAGAFASSGNYLKIDGDFAQIDLPKSGNSDRKNILEVFEKSGTGTIKVFSGSDLNYGIILPPFSGIKFGTGISSSGILVERGMRLYTKRNQQMELILRDKILNLKEGDKIFSGPKESTIKIFKPLEFFSFGKVKIFPDEKNISVKLNKNLDFNFEDFDKRNLGFFGKIFDYFSTNFGTNKKYSSNPMGSDNDSRFIEYQKNIQTIIPDDKYSSDKSFKIADSLNGKTIKGGDKILIKGTAWPNTQIKFSVDGEAMGTTTTDGSGTFLFRLPKGFKAKYGTFDNNTKTIKIDNVEQKNLSKELIVSISNNSTGTYLQENEILNKDRNFEKKNGFINFTEKIMKLPIFGW